MSSPLLETDSKNNVINTPWWALHRHLWNWTEHLAESRHAATWLTGLSFAESSFFPIPPDTLLLPLCIHAPKRWWFLALLTTLGSVVGALAAWYLGAWLWGSIDQWCFEWIPGFTQSKFDKVSTWYDQYGFAVVFIAAFTPIPYKVFTLAAGVVQLPLIPFIVASLIGRGLRFFMVAGISAWLGAKAKPLIERWLDCISLILGLLAIGVIAYMSLRH